MDTLRRPPQRPSRHPHRPMLTAMEWRTMMTHSRMTLISQNLNLSHVLSDRQNRFGRVVGSHGLPTTLFYNAEGHLVDTHMGELSRASLARSLERFDPAYLRPATGSD